MYRWILAIILFCGFQQKEQYEFQLIERYTNSFKNQDPKGDVYLVVGFSDSYCNNLFDSSNNCNLRIFDIDKKLNKSELYKNPKTKLWEYYHFLSKATKLEEIKLFEILIFSNDSSYFTKILFNEKDKRKVIRQYRMPDANASAKEKLKYYKKTGDRQGQLMGQAKIIVIYRRMTCKAKKRKFRKEGINGTKEMTIGM